ncbi:hypothetical protein VTI28DRAFT_8385 [Corynascus sepedonium]
MASESIEHTPLLGGPELAHHGAAAYSSLVMQLRPFFDIERRILFAGFLTTLSFSFTPVPIFYAFRLMECDAFYARNPPYEGTGDRCSRNEIAAGTATQFSILCMSTTLCGTINLFVAGWMAKRFNPRAALMVQTFVPAIRVATQILGVLAGGQAGIIIFQCTQLITIIGGPAGYILVANIIAGEVTEPLRRTAVFGMLQGCNMLGQGIGHFSAGKIGDAWGVRRPFEIAFGSFLLTTLYVRVAVPHITVESLSSGSKPDSKGITGLLSPLRVLAPQKVLLSSGVIRKHYGVLFLCAGVFLGVLATGYAPLLIQMYATAVFGFKQGDNGWLMSEFAFMRAAFLIFLFPRIINKGRRWYLTRGQQEGSGSASLATNSEELGVPVRGIAEEEPVRSAEEGTAFDLFFLRISLVVDGVMTMCATFATKNWHIYLAAFLLPFASGSTPAAKGVMTKMCSTSRRADALEALTVIENIAKLATQALFGFVFAALAQIGKPRLTFFANAGIALLASGVLLLSRFPLDGSQPVDNDGTMARLYEHGEPERREPQEDS